MRYEHCPAAAAAAGTGTRVAGTSAGHAGHQSSEYRDSPLHAAHSPATTTASGHHDIDEELRDAFQVFDKDRDGFLSATDLRSVQITHVHCISSSVTAACLPATNSRRVNYCLQ